jgi:Mg2+/Co2+ transporter CorB
MDPAALDTAFWLTVAFILLLLAVSAFFSGSETALTAASRAKLRAQADRGSRGAQAALQLTDNRERMIGAILLGNNAVNILAAALATALLMRVFGDAGVALATLGMTVLVLVFGEMLPKTLAIARPEPFAARVAAPVRFLMRLLAPPVALVRPVVRGILRLFGVRADPAANVLAIREEIMGAIELGHEEGAVEKEDRDRLLATLDLSDRMVEEVMLHRSQIEMIDADQPAEQILAQILASPYSRLPVFRGSEEDILGVVHAKDVLRELDRVLRAGPQAPQTPGLLAGFDITRVMRKPYFVPETTDLDDQMRQFLKRRTHFALVVDEYGSLRGLVTLEDIIEEIVGEIADEFDVTGEAPPQPGESGDYLIDGATTIRDLNRAFGWSLPDDEANTIAGLVIHEAQTIPSEGQVFSFHGFRFEVVSRRENRIARLKLRPL